MKDKPFDAYAAVEAELLKWCAEHYYTSLIVWLRLDGVETAEYAMLNYERLRGFSFDFENDWWEGEEDVEITDIVPLEEVPRMGKINIKLNRKEPSL